MKGKIEGILKRVITKLFPNNLDKKLDVVINHKKKFIFIRMPKVANTSIRKALSTGFPNEVHEIKLQRSDISSKYSDYFVFSFVRNPFSRIVSCYNNKICFKFRNEVEYLFTQFPALFYKMSFKYFVEFLTTRNGSDLFADRHWLSQYYYLYDNKMNKLCDYIGKFENLKDDQREVSKRLEINNDLGHYKPHSKMSNIDVTKSEDYYKGFYDEGLKNKISKRYKEDFDYFNYGIENV